jgi:tRNA dimethylallyltransferase
MSTLLRRQEPATPGPRWLEFALFPADRAWLHQRIDTRFARMLEIGLVDELRGLRARHPLLHAGLPAMRCVGYRQAWRFLDGEIDAPTLHEQGAAATRQLAKRQITWLRSWEGAEKFDCATTDLRDQIARRIETAIKASPPFSKETGGGT